MARRLRGPAGIIVVLALLALGFGGGLDGVVVRGAVGSIPGFRRHINRPSPAAMSRGTSLPGCLHPPHARACRAPSTSRPTRPWPRLESTRQEGIEPPTCRFGDGCSAN